jgi:histidinol-phosphate/aromatic aminotransferase/cobyric acid decarboxylase-like protein
MFIHRRRIIFYAESTIWGGGGAKPAKDLTERLLASHNIFIKDLTGKKGIPGSDFIRIAIRGKEDNDLFIETLTDNFMV